MTPVSRNLACALVAVALSGIACSSVAKLADDAGTGGGTGALSGTGGADTPSGTGGAAGPDTSCIDGSDGCVWSCAAGAETGSGDAPQPFCDGDGQFRCPAGSQALSTCPAGSCARFDTPSCCDPMNGHLNPPPCKADGFRDVCSAGSSPAENHRCIPDGTGVAQCIELEGQPCVSVRLQCHGGAVCRCAARSEGALVWACEVVIP